jgi:hypothetical protein
MPDEQITSYFDRLHTPTRWFYFITVTLQLLVHVLVRVWTPRQLYILLQGQAAAG